MSIFPRNLTVVGVVTFIVMLIAPAQAQSNYGALRGIVSDVQGGALGNATVTLTSDSTKITRTTVTNGSGEYAFGAVEPGSYKVSAAMAGFKAAQRNGVVIDSGNTIPLDLRTC